jgi:hypothetical protein
VEAVQESVIEVAVGELLVNPLGADGALASGQALVAAEVEDRLERLPALSYASTANK